MADIEIDSGTDHLVIYDGVTNAAGTTALDVSTWDLSWMVKTSARKSDANATIVKTSDIGMGITVSGVFDADPDTNAQVITVALVDTDTATVTAGKYVHELKRMDDGLEAVLSRGTLTLTQSVHRD
jgi:hypothetical protein